MRKSYLILLVGVLLSACSYPIKNLDSKGKNIICFGDSITSGEGLASKKEAYPYLLGELLKREVINAGRSGDTTASALERLDKDVLEKDPYLVIIELGGNDFLQRVPLQNTLRNLEEMILRIQKKGASVALVDISCGFILSSYRKAYKELAKKTGSIFISQVLKDIFDNPSLKRDYLHPNALGHKIIAERIYKVIEKFLK